jgi:hypothetical protein
MNTIPLWLSNDGNLCIYNALQAAYEVSCWAFGCLITLVGLGCKGLFYQSNLAKPLISGKQNLLLFQNCPTSLHTNPFQGNPTRKFTRNWVITNNTINSKHVPQPHMDHFQKNHMGKSPKKTWAYQREDKRILFHHNLSLCNMSQH